MCIRDRPNDLTHQRRLNFLSGFGLKVEIPVSAWRKGYQSCLSLLSLSVDLILTWAIFLRHSYSLRKGRISMYLRPKPETMSMWSWMFCAIYLMNHVCSIGHRDIILPDAAWNILCRSHCVFPSWKCIFWLHTQINVQIEVITYILVKLFRSFGKILSL